MAALSERPPSCPRGWAILERGVNEKILNQKSSPLTLVIAEQHCSGLSHKCFQPLNQKIKDCNAQLQGCWGAPGLLSLTHVYALTFCSQSKAVPERGQIIPAQTLSPLLFVVSLIV